MLDKGIITNFEYLDSHVMFWSERDILFQLSKQDMIIEKDSTGDLFCEFALTLPGADPVRLQQAVIDKDKIGEFCPYFARAVEGANIKQLRQAAAAKLNGDDTYLTYFSQIQKHKAKGFF